MLINKKMRFYIAIILTVLSTTLAVPLSPPNKLIERQLTSLTDATTVATDITTLVTDSITAVTDLSDLTGSGDD